MSVLSYVNLKPSKQHQLQWVNYAKAIAIILVVYRHALTGMLKAGLHINDFFIVANDIVLNFRMPLFFLVSGLFFQKSLEKRKFKGFVANKIYTILQPYFIWGSIQLLVQIAFSDYTNKGHGWRDFLNLLIHPMETDQFWYLYSLFMVMFLYSVMTTFTKIPKYAQVVLGLAMHACIPFVKSNDILFYLCNFYVYFAIGDLISTFMLTARGNELFSSSRLCWVLLPLFVAAQAFWFTHQDQNVLVMFLISLFGSFFVLSIAHILDKKKKLSFLLVLGQHSMPIYLLHVMVIAFLRIFMVKVLGVANAYVLLPLSILLGLYLPIIFYQITVGLGAGWLFSGEKKKAGLQKQNPNG